jgi:putative Mn2+ efflux pump MntP
MKASKLALILAFFQALMFLAGWYLGRLIFSMLEYAELMIAASILVVIGVKKVWSSVKLKHDEKSFNIDLNIILFGLAFAHSLDSFITSLGSEYFNISIKNQVIYLYIFSAVFSFVGIFVGKNIPCKLCSKIASFTGGLILAGLGIILFFYHTP